jgi:osmotically-inducible protein OsmY
VEVHRNEVILHGTVKSDFQRRIAEEIVQSIPGVSTIRNDIAVVLNNR